MNPRSRLHAPRLYRMLLIGLVLLVGAAVILSASNSISPKGIVVHHSAMGRALCAADSPASVIDHHHRLRGYGIFYWGSVYHIGYHYVIDVVGHVEPGRPETSRGAHTTGHNDYLGVLLVGNF